MNAMLLLKVSLLLLATLAGAHLLRRAPAIARHRLWSGVFMALLALPALTTVLPVMQIPFLASWVVPAFPSFTVASPTTSVGSRVELAEQGAKPDGSRAGTTGRPGIAPPPLARRWPGPGMLFVIAWLTGAVAAAAALVLSLRRVRRLAQAANPVMDPAWQSAADRIGACLGLRHRARLLWSPDVGTPMAGGLLRPAVFLPESARAWTAEQRDIVLTHEIAHLAARDPLRHVVARLALACYWFHPLAWIAARHASMAREQACDEVVLSRGVRPSAYARMLLDLAESLDSGAPTVAALPMVQGSTVLEKRVMTILNSDVRPVTRRMVMIPVLGVAALTLGVAAAQPAPPRSRVTTITASDATIDGASTARSADVAGVAGHEVRFDGDIRVAVATEQPAARDSACWWESTRSSSFTGSMSVSDSGGRTVIREQVGSRGTDRVIQKDFGDLRLCMVAEGIGGRNDSERPSQWIDRATRLVLETERRSAVQRLEIDRPGGGVERTRWQVGGAERPLDAAARQWRSQVLAALDTTWELSTLRGQESSLRGEISSIHGERSSLQGEISSLHGAVSSMRGRASAVRGEESSLRGEISSIRGHLSSLRGAVSSEQGAISSLNASRYDSDRSLRSGITTRIAEHDAQIQRIEREIRDYNADARVAAVEKEIARLDADGTVAAIEASIKAFDLDGKVAAIERRIAALDVDRRVAAIERQITALDVDRRSRQLEQRRAEEITRLEAAIGAIR